MLAATTGKALRLYWPRKVGQTEKRHLAMLVCSGISSLLKSYLIGCLPTGHAADMHGSAALLIACITFYTCASFVFKSFSPQLCQGSSVIYAQFTKDFTAHEVDSIRMATRNVYSESKTGDHVDTQWALDQDNSLDDAYCDPGSTPNDLLDMQRMGKNKKQNLRRNFRFTTILAFVAIAMGTWEIILSATAAGLTNGGTGGMIWMFVGTYFCFGTIVLSLAEMSSMA